MPCPIFTDQEILDRIEADVTTTLNFLKARVLAQYGDLQSIRRMDVHTEEAAKTFDGTLQDLTADVVGHLRKKLPDVAEYRADQITACRLDALDASLPVATAAE